MSGDDHLLRVLKRFVGRTCIGYTAGGAAGSHVNLEFEPRVPRLRPLNNPYLSEEQRLTEGEYAVFVLCVWRLDSEDEVICGAWDDNSEGGPMLSGLDRLVGKKLKAFNLARPGLDLDLHFADYSFRIFCDSVNELDMEDNYSLFFSGETLVVATRSRIEQERRDE